ncbi:MULTISPECIES: HAD hydrolase-like protein [unclassified Ruminococcus]|uniref:HAD hydrolase-like protein n=1 Tax=unclassified Ruminococcus TaxID=2608920 RepID=UPI00210B1EC0|nr:MULTISPECIES: HAD hydrolase-like protein [unclassified Ruminococcus]MCQ4021893.1 HAD hydrolase-like protein [Ruminococcus sp. zg-924]MCQ4114338.1 HAD hydrolase-like protein [Ruminococcus sp. zg-921]
MKSKYKIVLFDLDGTLSNSAKGVQLGIEAALQKMNKPVPDLSDYSQYVGPPLLTTFQKLCGLTKEEAVAAVELYRDDYEQRGKYENYQYEGMRELLETLRGAGAVTAVATSKYEPFAKWVIEYIGLGGAFDAVCGSTLDGKRKEKADIVRYAADTLNVEISKQTICLVGDTMFDAAGAVQAGCDFVGVSYGFGTAEQIINAGGTRIAASVSELYNLLFE